MGWAHDVPLILYEKYTNVYDTCHIPAIEAPAAREQAVIRVLFGVVGGVQKRARRFFTYGFARTISGKRLITSNVYKGHG